jgi:hypothetical protein
MTASDAEARVEQAVAAKLDSGTRWLLRREIGNLAQLLPAGEKIVHMAQGRHEGATGLIVATDYRVLFVEQGIAHSRVEDYPYVEIRAIQVDVSVVASELKISRLDDEVTISRVYPKDRTLEIADYVRTRTSLPGERGHALGRMPTRE